MQAAGLVGASGPVFQLLPNVGASGPVFQLLPNVVASGPGLPATS